MPALLIRRSSRPTRSANWRPNSRIDAGSETSSGRTIVWASGTSASRSLCALRGLLHAPACHHDARTRTGELRGGLESQTGIGASDHRGPHSARYVIGPPLSARYPLRYSRSSGSRNSAGSRMLPWPLCGKFAAFAVDVGSGSTRCRRAGTGRAFRGTRAAPAVAVETARGEVVARCSRFAAVAQDHLFQVVAAAVVPVGRGRADTPERLGHELLLQACRRSSAPRSCCRGRDA